MSRSSASSPSGGAFAIAGGLLFAASLVYFAWQYVVGFERPAPSGAVVRPLAVNVVLFTLFAMHHSLFARTGIKAAIARAAGASLERSTYVWIASLLFLAVCAFWQPVAGAFWQTPAPWAWLLYGVQIAGAVFTIAAARRLDVMELAGISQALGRTSSRHGLDDHGPYGIVRHPIYLAWLMLVWSTPHMNGTRLAFAAISTLYLLVAIPFEERDLRTTFGAAYTDYSSRVRWKILPGIY